MLLSLAFCTCDPDQMKSSLILTLILPYNRPKDPFYYFSTEHAVIGSTTRTTQMSRGMFKKNNLVWSYRAPQDCLPVVCVCVSDGRSGRYIISVAQTPGLAFEHENNSTCSQRADSCRLLWAFLPHKHSPRCLYGTWSEHQCGLKSEFSVIRAAGLDQAR